MRSVSIPNVPRICLYIDSKVLYYNLITSYEFHHAQLSQSTIPWIGIVTHLRMLNISHVTSYEVNIMMHKEGYFIYGQQTIS